jgi:excisionase family DNA binding protein
MTTNSKDIQSHSNVEELSSSNHVTSKEVTLKTFTVAQLMTPQQLAEYLQVEVSTIYTWASRRKIPRRKVGHLLRFDVHEILDWTKGKKA